MAACVDSCRARQSKVEARGHLLLLHKSIPKECLLRGRRLGVRARRERRGRGASHGRCNLGWKGLLEVWKGLRERCG